MLPLHYRTIFVDVTYNHGIAILYPHTSILTSTLGVRPESNWHPLSHSEACLPLHHEHHIISQEGGVRTHAPHLTQHSDQFPRLVSSTTRPLPDIYCRGKEIRTLEHQFPKLARVASAEHPDISF